MDYVTKKELKQTEDRLGKVIKDTEKRLKKFMVDAIKEGFSQFYDSIFLPFTERNEKDHAEMLGRLDENDKDHERIFRSLERNREEHDEMFVKLDSIEKKLGNHEKRIKKLEVAISS